MRTRLKLATGLAAALALQAAAGMQMPDLQRLIELKQPRSIEDLLPLLPEDLRARYVLMYRSRSLHGASYARPRAILFSRDARFVLSFNGEASQAGYLNLEVMQFDDASQTFELREVTFPDPSAPASPPAVSAANPARCLACHGQPARPVWDTHPTWPGAYGTNFAAGLGAAERQGLGQFLRDQPRHPRYRHLLEIRRFANLETFRPGARERYEGDEDVPPNGQLGEALGRLNFQAILHQLESSPRYPAYRYALLAAMSGDCGSMALFFPPAQRPAIEAALARFAAATAQANGVQARAKQIRASEAGSGGQDRLPPPATVESLDRFRFVVENGIGLKTAQWTTALEKDSYDFSWSPSASGEMNAYLRARLARTDGDLETLAGLRAYSGRDAYCTHLRQRSRAALQALESTAVTVLPAAGNAWGNAPDDPSPSAQSVSSLLARCAGCHGAGAGPYLPFDREAELAQRLPRGAYARGTLLDEIRWRLGPSAGAGRMPLGVNPPDEDRAGLMSYFERLAASAASP